MDCHEIDAFIETASETFVAAMVNILMIVRLSESDIQSEMATSMSHKI